MNARATAIGRRPKIGTLPVTSGKLEHALVGSGDAAFRRDGDLTMHPTRFLERLRLPLGEQIRGPAVIFQLDTTILVPPSWTARADPSSVLVLSR